jgi:penicillin-insensitive murein endopeptidase
MNRAVFVLALGCSGCFGTPTPLAPGLSGSVGAPHHGVITDAVELPAEGDGFVRYRKNGENHWGNPRLVRALETAAANVREKMPGVAPLVVGDLSGHFGGKIPRHQSHRSGRDVDLPWFVTTPEGIPVRNPGFVNVAADGLARVEGTDTFVRLDVPREWLLVKELVTSKDADVLWMFCSREVEALLVEYARARGEPMDLVWRAETVLWQPGDSLTHDDHIHLRIACTPEEAVLGCEGGGPRWEWLSPLPELTAADGALAESALDDPPLQPLPPSSEDAESAQGG